MRAVIVNNYILSSNNSTRKKLFAYCIFVNNVYNDIGIFRQEEKPVINNAIVG